MEGGGQWIRSNSAACQEPQNLPTGAQGTGGVSKGPELSPVVSAHPGWVKLEGKSCSTDQRNDEFSERSNAEL